MDNCYSSANRQLDGAEDAEFMHERLTNKHIKTLTFLQDLARENKELKETVKLLEGRLVEQQTVEALAEEHKARTQQIQEKCLRQVDKTVRELTDKFTEEITLAKNERLVMERAHNEEKRKLHEEVEASKKQVNKLLKELETWNMHNCRENCTEEVDALSRQIKQCQEENRHLREVNANQLKELQMLLKTRGKLDSLQLTMSEKEATIREQAIRVAKLQKQLSDNNEDKRQEMIERLQKRVVRQESQLQQMLEADQRMQKLLARWEEKYGELSERHKRETAKLATELESKREENRELSERLEQAQRALAALDKHQQSFRDFVELKREVLKLREENQQLKRACAENAGTAYPLTAPLLKTLTAAALPCRVELTARSLQTGDPVRIKRSNTLKILPSQGSAMMPSLNGSTNTK